MLRLCAAVGNHGTFVVGEGEAAERLAIPPPRPTPTTADADKAGHWVWAALSPDGSTLLAQWAAECETPIAFFVSLPAGTPRAATGETDWAKSPDSEALGGRPTGTRSCSSPTAPHAARAPGGSAFTSTARPVRGCVSSRRTARTDRPVGALEPPATRPRSYRRDLRSRGRHGEDGGA